MVFQNKGEQNFHIFYYLIAGLEDGQNGKYFLTNKTTKRPIKFNYIQERELNGVTKMLDKLRMKEKFDELLNALNYIAFMETVT